MTRLSLTFNKMTSQAVEWTWNHTGVYATGDSGTNGLINKLKIVSILTTFYYTQSGIVFWPDLVVFSKVGFLRKLGTLLLK